MDVKLDRTKFDATFQEYVKASGRSLPQIVNNKLFMIARQSLWFTEKADKKSIAKTLGKITYLRQKNYTPVYRHTLRKARDYSEAPLAAIIAHKRKKKKDGHGFTGPGRFAAMRQAIQVLIGARNASVAYIKSGWLPAIQTLAKVSTIKAGNVRDDKAARQIGKPKGRALAAKDFSKRVTGFIENEAWAKRDKKKAFQRYGGAGLQAAFNYETQRMIPYIEERLGPAAEKFNAAQR
jgi:hypothetical protein